MRWARVNHEWPTGLREWRYEARLNGRVVGTITEGVMLGSDYRHIHCHDANCHYSMGGAMAVDEAKTELRKHRRKHHRVVAPV